eukprot:EC821274.1.p1 GENE.EC821274.1~~EC821274.1.p1  ORF type:complete len:153 (+),score=56.81 EC821274.1:73-531(+)
MPLNSSEVLDAKEVFKLYDRDVDGFISISDLGQVIRSCNHNPSSIQIEEITKEIDPQGTGKFDFNSLKNILDKIVCIADDQKEVTNSLKIFDKENTGFISLSELRGALTTLGEKIPSQIVDSLLNQAQQDGDGNINVTDMVNVLFKKEGEEE